jgi:hypothetical protein
MKKSIRKLVLPVAILLTIILVYACQKENSASSSSSIPSGKANLSVFLTDGPYDFQKVLIDIKSIQVLVDTCHQSGDQDSTENDQNGDDHNNEGDQNNHDGDHNDNQNGQDDHDSSANNCEVWSDLQINPGIYDLLTLRNGTDTLLGSSFIPKGKIMKIKINLGSRNSIMADSVTSPLEIRDGSDFFIIKIRGEQIDSISANNFNLILDFNLAKSIHFEDGVYWLRPEIRAFSKKHTGEIEGKVGPEHSFGLIRAANATDTAYALPEEDEEGEFKICGLKEGVYSVLIGGINGYQDSTINNVQVLMGEETKLGKIVLHK